MRHRQDRYKQMVDEFMEQVDQGIKRGDLEWRLWRPPSVLVVLAILLTATLGFGLWYTMFDQLERLGGVYVSWLWIVVFSAMMAGTAFLVWQWREWRASDGVLDETRGR